MRLLPKTLQRTFGLVLLIPGTALHAQESRPGYLEPYVDERFGSRVTRVTGEPGKLIPQLDARWSEVARHGYSKEAAWNSDQSLLLLRQHHGFPSMIFLDGSSYEPVFGRNAPPVTEVRWASDSPDEMIFVEGNQIGRWNVRTDERTVLASFPGYSEFHIGPWEGNLSLDGDRLAVSAKKGNEPVAFCYDFEEEKKFPDLPLSAMEADWVSVSASGEFLVVNGKFEGERGDQTQVFDLDGNPIGALWSEYGRPSHYDLTVDEQGDDVAVGVSKSSPDEGRVIKRRLKDGAVTVLTPGGYASHTSTRNGKRRGWAYVTFQYSGPDWPRFRDEVVAVKLDGSHEVERIASLHSKRVDYLTEAHAVPSPDGTRVLWASAREQDDGRPVGAYVAEVWSDFAESFDSPFHASRFSTKIPNKNTTVQNGALLTKGSSGGKYPPMVYLPVKGRDMRISFRYRHRSPGGWLWFFVDGDDGYGSVDHMLRVKLLRKGVQLQVDSHSQDENHPLRQNNGRPADRVSGAFRLNEKLPLDPVDLEANDWRTVELVFRGEEVTITLDGDRWRKKLARPCFDAAKRKLLWMQNGGSAGIELDDIEVTSLPR